RSGRLWRSRGEIRSSYTGWYSTRAWISPARAGDRSGRSGRAPGVSGTERESGNGRGPAREQPDLVAAASLRLVERVVGRAQQGLGFRDAVGVDCDAHRRRDAQQAAFLAHRLADRLGAGLCARQRGVRKHQPELLAPETARDVAAADIALEQRRDPHQHFVARAVARGVVNALEVVEVDHEHGDAGALALAADHFAGEVVVQEAPVVKV